MIDYAAESMAFQKRCNTDKLSLAAKSLWHALLNLAAELGWPDGYISLPLTTLCCYAGIGKDSLFDARNQLKTKGLIDFKTGNRNAQSAQYMMIYITGDVWSEKQSKTLTKQESKTANKTASKMPTNKPNIRYTEEDEDNIYGEYGEEEEDTTAGNKRARVRTAFLEAIGREAYPVETDMLLSAGDGMDLDVIVKAIMTAGMNGASSPARYAAKTLEDWSRYGIRTADQLWEFESDMSIARDKTADAEAVCDAMDRLNTMLNTESRKRLESIIGKGVTA